MRKKIFALSMFCCVMPSLVLASFTVSGTSFEKVSETSFSKFFIHVYDISLWAEGGAYDASKPHALNITYDVEISKEDLAERSVEELQAVSDATTDTLKDWEKKMLSVFRNVKEGDRIRAVSFPNKEIRFFYNDQPTGIIKDTNFVSAFMGIWLSEKTSEPSMRKRLIAQE